MFCPKCGCKIPAGAAFCPNCGAKVQAAAPAQPSSVPSGAAQPETDVQPNTGSSEQNEQSTTQTRQEPEGQSDAVPYIGPSVPPVVPQSAQNNAQPAGDPLAAIVGKHADYYLAEFKKIDAGQKPRFNWAAFLLGPMMCFYRRSGELFKKYYLLYFILFGASCVLFTVSSISMAGGGAFGIGFALFVLTDIYDIFVAIINIFVFVMYIRFGKNFNREYYNHCKQQLEQPASARKPGTSAKKMWLFIMAVAVIWIVWYATTILITQQVQNAYWDSLWEDSSYSEDTYSESSSYYDEAASYMEESSRDNESDYEPGSSEILHARWDEFLDSSGENEILFLEADNDCDGLLEVFAVTAGEYDADMGFYFNAKIYFINSNGKMNSVCDTAPDGSPLYGYPTEAMLSPDGGDGFFVWNLATGTSNYSLVWGVKDDRFYETNISGQYCEVSLDDGRGFTAYQLDYSQGYRDYVAYRLNYDSSTHAFTATVDASAYPTDSGPVEEDYSMMAYDPTGIYQIIGNDGYVASVCLWMEPTDAENPFYCDIRSWNGESFWNDYYGPARVPADLQSIACGDFIFGIDENGVPFFNDPMIEVPYGIYYYSESTFSEMQINALVDAAAYAGMNISTDLLTAYVGDAGLDPSMIYELM